MSRVPGGHGEEDGAKIKDGWCWWLMLLTHSLKDDNQLAWESSREEGYAGRMPKADPLIYGHSYQHSGTFLLMNMRERFF